MSALLGSERPSGPRPRTITHLPQACDVTLCEPVSHLLSMHTSCHRLTLGSFCTHRDSWVNSAVARLVYQDVARAAPVVRCARQAFEEWAAPEVEKTETAAAARFAAGDDKGGREALTALALKAGKEANSRWTALWSQLMVTFADGATAAADGSNMLCGCSKETPRFDDNWLAKLTTDTGDHYRLPSSACGYLDPDGHCHPKPPSAAAHVGSSDGWAPVSKLLVPGVAA